jgi:hypothetical protein
LSPTAATGGISGRVVTESGAMISQATVTLTDGNGNARRALTNSFGYYRFENLPVGQTYILSVSGKRYQFPVPTQIVNLQDNLTEVNFTAF